jgi:hypothetical protein
MAPPEGGFAATPMAPGTTDTSTPLMAPPSFSPSNLTPALGMVASKIFPDQFDPNKIASQNYLRQETIGKELANRELQMRPTTEAATAALQNIPLAPGMSISRTTQGGGTVEAKGLSTLEKERDRNDALNQRFTDAVNAEIERTGKPFPEAADAVMNKNFSTYGSLPTTYPGPAAAHEFRKDVYANQKADDRNQQQMDQQARQFAQQMRMEAIREGDTFAPGVYGNKVTGEIGQVTKGEYRKAPAGTFKRVSQQDQSLATRLQTAGPMLDAMDYLVPKVLAKGNGQSLPSIIATYSENLAKHKIGVDPDIQQLMQLGTGLAAEQAAALGGTSRVLGQMFQAIRGESVPGLTVTAPVAQRMLSTARTEIGNRINGIAGRDMEAYGVGRPPALPSAPTPEGSTFVRDPKTGKLVRQ